MIFSRLQSKMNGNQPLDWLRYVWFMAGLQNWLLWKQTKISAERSEVASMTTWWTRGGGNQAQDRKKRRTHWQIQIIFTQINQYRAQIFVHVWCRLCARYVHSCNCACNLWGPDNQGHNFGKILEKYLWRIWALVKLSSAHTLHVYLKMNSFPKIFHSFLNTLHGHLF